METYTTVKGQIVIPVKLRRKYGIKEGTRVIWRDTGDSIVLRPITDQYIRNLRGSLKDVDALQLLLDERQKDKEKGK